MKKRFLSFLISVMAMMNFTIGGYGATAIEDATRANLAAGLTYWTNFHGEWLKAVKDSLDGDKTAIPNLLEKWVVNDGAFRDKFLFAPDASMYYSTLVSSNVFGELKTLLGLTGFAKGEIDTGNITLSDGSTMRVSIILNRPSIGLAKGSKQHRDHYEDIITVTRTLLTMTINDVSTQSLSVTARTFVDTLGGNDLKMSYTAKTAAGLTTSTASTEGYVAASNVAVIYKSTFTKPVYTAANIVAGTVSYSHNDSEGYTLADGKVAHYLGATGMAASSLTYLRAATCPTAPPCNNFITVTNAEGQPVSSVMIGDTVTIKADFSSVDGVKSVIVVGVPIGGGEQTILGAVNNSALFEQTIAIPVTAPVGSVAIMAVAFDAEYVVDPKSGDPVPTGKPLQAATYLLEITSTPTAPAITVSVNGKTVVDGATLERGSMLDIVVDFSSVTGVTNTKLSIIDSAGGRTTELRSAAGATLTYTYDTTNDQTGGYTVRAEGSGSDTRTVVAEFKYTLSEPPQIP